MNPISQQMNVSKNMFDTLSTHSVLCQLYLNKAGGKLEKREGKNAFHKIHSVRSLLFFIPSCIEQLLCIKCGDTMLKGNGSRPPGGII